MIGEPFVLPEQSQEHVRHWQPEPPVNQSKPVETLLVISASMSVFFVQMIVWGMPHVLGLEVGVEEEGVVVAEGVDLPPGGRPRVPLLP